MYKGTARTPAATTYGLPHSTRAFAGADQVVLASIFRSSLPPEERLSESRLVDDLRAGGVAARHLPSVDAIVAAVASEARDGDVVVVMSNGGFGGIHGKLLDALR